MIYQQNVDLIHTDVIPATNIAEIYRFHFAMKQLHQALSLGKAYTVTDKASDIYAAYVCIKTKAWFHPHYIPIMVTGSIKFNTVHTHHCNLHMHTH